MPILIFFVAHWYLSLFSQSFLQHRYAAHADFTMNKFWERIFYIFAYITQGSSYMSARSYAIMHRMHHAYTDTEKDPHSPQNFSNVFGMMVHTMKIYRGILHGSIEIQERFLQKLPDWPVLDRWGHSAVSRIIWIGIYIGYYIYFATSPLMFLLIPVHVLTGPIHGAIINWFAHKYGYVNFKLNNTSRNLLPLDIIMLGEAYHNNHHKYASSINFGVRWFEIDPIYYIILFFNWLGIVKIKNTSLKRVVSEF